MVDVSTVGPANIGLGEVIGLAGRTILGAVSGILWPTPTSGTDVPYPQGWSGPNPSPLAPYNPAIEDTVMHPSGEGGSVFIGQGRDWFVPRVAWQDQVPAIAGLPSPPTVQGQAGDSLPWDEGYGGWWEVEAGDPSRFNERFQPGGIWYTPPRSKDRNVGGQLPEWYYGHSISRGPVAHVPGKVQPLPDLDRSRIWLPDMPQQTFTPREDLLRLKVEELDGMVRFTMRRSSSRMGPEKKRRDTKAHEKRLVGKIQHIVTRSYGVVSELRDTAEVFAWSLYGRTADGKVLPAMALAHGSMSEALRGYLAGEYRLDAAGFVVDLALNQGFQDYAIGYASRLEMAAASRLGGSLGYRALRVGRTTERMNGESHVSPLVHSAQGWLSETLDPIRASRVQQLW